MRTYSPQLALDARRLLNTKTADSISSDMSEQTALVIPLVPCSEVIRDASRTGSGTSTVFTTPLDKDFYVTAAYLTASADAASDSTSFSLYCSEDMTGVIRNLLRLFKQTLTAYAQTASISYPVPLRLPRGVTIEITTSSTVGALRLAGGIVGFTIDNG